MAGIISIMLSCIFYLSGLSLGYLLGAWYGVLFGFLLFMALATMDSPKLFLRSLVMVSYIIIQFLSVLLPMMGRVAF